MKKILFCLSVSAVCFFSNSVRAQIATSSTSVSTLKESIEVNTIHNSIKIEPPRKLEKDEVYITTRTSDPSEAPKSFIAKMVTEKKSISETRIFVNNPIKVSSNISAPGRLSEPGK